MGSVDPKTLTAPFFQIGVNEIRGRPPHGQARTVYYAFWSSTTLGFHPQFLFSVRPGDAVQLSMALADSHWSMLAKDQTTGRSQIVTAASGGAVFTQANWFQEDIAKNNAGAQEPYPKLGPVRFSHIAVNSGVPQERLLITSWMSTDRGTFGPTLVSVAEFAVTRVHPSSPDIRYQQIAFNLNYASIAFGRDLETWTEQTPQRTIRAASTRFAHALQTNVREFQSYTWPRHVQPLVTRLLAATRKSRVIVLALATASPSELTQGTAIYASSVRRVRKIALQVKARLHIPPSNYSGPAVANYARTNSG